MDEQEETCGTCGEEPGRGERCGYCGTPAPEDPGAAPPDHGGEG
jgi:hypothetical protein